MISDVKQRDLMKAFLLLWAVIALSTAAAWRLPQLPLRSCKALVTATVAIGLLSAPVLAEESTAPTTIDLNKDNPVITDTCWMDITIGDDSSGKNDPQRIEIGLFGQLVPETVRNFKALCANEPGYGYRDSDFFRVISEFSVQGGNIGQPPDAPKSQIGKYGKSAVRGVGFPVENYLINHDYAGAGVVSMMKDRAGLQDSRFFITLSPAASWADNKYSAFGRVTKGMPFIENMQIVPVQPPANYPLSRIHIIDSGIYEKTN